MKTRKAKLIRRFIVGLVAGILLSSIIAKADIPTADRNSFSLALDPSGISSSEKDSLQTFLESAEKLIPDGMKQGIGRKILVRFSPMGNQTSLEVPACFGDPTAETVSNSSKAKMELLGHDDFGGHASVVDLNSLFKQEILLGPAATRTYSCGHRSMYRLALATLIHELAHVYDADQGKNESSRNSFFQKLMGFTKQWDMHAFLFRGVETKNHLYLRSPDPYEFKNIKESFAVNVEYFVLDSDFACRRPTVDHYLRGMFGVTAQPSCTLNTTVQENSNNAAINLKQSLNLDPSRIYDVHYLLASKGDAMMSKWGHAMYRLIVCAPERKVAGPECLQDVQYHVILSYRANVQDVVLSYWKGMNGQYPSQLYILPLPEVLTEYNKLELRDLISLPLGLTPEQKEQFVYRTIEQYWEYQGRYYFLTNNCANEALDFLQGIVPDKKIQKLHDMTPLGLEGDLSKTGLIDESILKDRNDSIAEGYFFASKRPVLDNAFAQVKARVQGLSIPDSNTFMNSTSATERREYFDAVMKSTTGDEHMKVAAFFYLLESYISSFDEQKIGGRVSAKLEVMADAQRKSGASGDGSPNSDFIKALQGDQPWSQLINGYGIPQQADFSQKRADDQSQLKSDAVKKLQQWIQEQFKDDLAEFQKIEENKAEFRLEIVAPKAPQKP